MSAPLETVVGVRSFLQDLLAPSIGRLDARLEALIERFVQLTEEVRDIRSAHEALLIRLNEEISSINVRIGRLEGRSEGLKEELTATLQLELLKAARSLPPVPRTSFLTSGEPASEP